MPPYHSHRNYLWRGKTWMEWCSYTQQHLHTHTQMRVCYLIKQIRQWHKYSSSLTKQCRCVDRQIHWCNASAPLENLLILSTLWELSEVRFPCFAGNEVTYFLYSNSRRNTAWGILFITTREVYSHTWHAFLRGNIVFHSLNSISSSIELC